jgi:hypothetical protein
MASFRYPIRTLPACLRAANLLVVVAALLFLSGCKQTHEVDDPQLKPIQAILEAKVPIGTSEGAVTQFLTMRGYPTEPSGKPGTIVAIIRHIDTEKLRPVTARVTFYFDANGKLNTYEIVRTMNAPIPQ